MEQRISPRTAAAVGGIGVGKHLSNVAQGGGPEQGVDHGVQQGVGVAVAHRLVIVGDVDAAKPQRAARLEAMSVVSESDVSFGAWPFLSSGKL